MRILLHDYGAYPFTTELSSYLAARGHQLLHAYCASLTNTPMGGSGGTGNQKLRFHGIDLGRSMEKYSYIKRWQQENEYGKQLVRVAANYKPDVILSANAPLDVQRILFTWAQSHDVATVYWLQDLIGLATEAELSKRLPGIGKLVGRYYAGLERRLLAQSDRVVAISDHFLPQLSEAGIDRSKVEVIGNWAPIADLPVRSRQNKWAQQQGLREGIRFMYTGNLGMKHNPEVLVDLARHLQEAATGEVIVVSQGSGADWLKEQKASHDLQALSVLPFQPMEALPDVMGAADVLVALLTPAAGSYSVPSKVLAYLCAGRPVLLSVPTDNPAAKMVQENNAGHVVSPGDTDGFLRAAIELATQPDYRKMAGAAGRQFAEQIFQPEYLADRFESVLAAARA